MISDAVMKDHLGQCSLEEDKTWTKKYSDKWSPQKNTRVTDVIHKRASDILESRKNGRKKRRKCTLSCIISPVEVIYDESLMALYGTGLVLSYRRMNL